VSPGRGVAALGWQAHQQHPISEVVEQGSADAAPQVRLRLVALTAGGGPHQLQPGLLAQILQLHQVGVATVDGASEAIG
jgi:hypothetical protein